MTKSQNAKTIICKDELSAAVFTYLLGHQFDTCCENLKVMNPKILEWDRLFLTLLHADLGRKSQNVLKFVNKRVLEQATNNKQINIYNNNSC